MLTELIILLSIVILAMAASLLVGRAALSGLLRLTRLEAQSASIGVEGSSPKY